MITACVLFCFDPKCLCGKLSLSFFSLFLSGIARAGLLTILIVAPWCFGGWPTRVQFWLYSSMLVVLGVWLLAALWQIFTTGLTLNRLPAAILPLFGAAILGHCQLAIGPVEFTSDSIQKTIQAAMVTSTDDERRTELVRDTLIHSLQTGHSIAPTVTRFEMTRLIMVIAAFLLGSQLFSTTTSQVYLWFALAIDGAALAFFGFAQLASWNGKMFWTIPVKYSGSVFSSFINRNNAAGYLCVCLACAIGIVIWSFSNELFLAQNKSQSVGHRHRRRHHRKAVLMDWVTQLSRLSPAQLVSVLLVILPATGVVLASSRGGWLAMSAAIVATLFVSFKNHRVAAAKFAAVAAVLCIGLVMWTNQEQRLNSRWKDFNTIERLSQDGRWGHWSDVLKAVSDFPMTGTGFGTYQFAYLPYQTHVQFSNLRFYHADNLFLEYLVEGGFIALALIFAFLFCCVISIWSLLNRKQFDSIEPGGTIGVFLIVSMCVSSFVDFGASMPSNMLALATLLGAITGRASLLARSRQTGQKKMLFGLPALGSSLMVLALGISLAVVGFQGVKEVEAAANVRDSIRQMPKLDSFDATDESSVTQLIDQLKSATESYPNDPDAHKALADLYLLRFRLQEFAIEIERSKDVSRKELWERTNPVLLLQQVVDWERSEQLERIQLLLAESTIQNNLEPCHSHLLQAQRACQLTPGVDQLLGMLNFLVPDDERYLEVHLRRALVTAPATPETFFVVGEIALLSEMNEFSYSSLKRSLELSPIYLPLIHQSLQGRISLDDEIEKVLPNSDEILIELAALYSPEANSFERHEIASRALERLSTAREGVQEAERHHNRARAHAVIGEIDEAIGEYGQALILSPLKSSWRTEFIRYLQLNKGVREALHEAEIAVALEPENNEFKGLVHDLRSQVVLKRAPTKRNSKVLGQ